LIRSWYWFCLLFFFFSSRRRHTRFSRDWSSDVCSSDLSPAAWDSAIPSTVSAAFCARYSSIDRQRSRESRPPSLCTKPTLATKRSEERRVGKEGRARWTRCNRKQNTTIVTERA